jgi:hypothetical protein
VLPGQMDSVRNLLSKLDDPGEVSRLDFPLSEP